MNKQKGITLIALVITIIVLLILAGVAISTLTGNDSIINNAGTAVEKYNEKALAEEAVLNALEKKLIEYSNGGGTSTDAPEEPDEPTPPSVDANGLLAKGEEPYTICPDPENNPNLQIVIPAGFAPAILKGATAENPTMAEPGADGSVARILPADQWNNITTTQVFNGIVVVDHAITYDNGQTTGTVPDFNEYVWVPITGNGRNTFAREAWKNKNYDDGRPYDLTESGYWEDTTTNEYVNMMESVSRNKGFYIGRYEASEDSTGRIAQSKRGQVVWSSLAQNDTSGIGAIQASANNPTANMHLVYGIEWDSTLNWLIESGEKTKYEIEDDSSTWGNYDDYPGFADLDWSTVTSVWRTAGFCEDWRANNVYDLAGNFHELTQEKWGKNGAVAHRGNYYDYGGGESNPSSYRDFVTDDDDNQSCAFRIGFFI